MPRRVGPYCDVPWGVRTSISGTVATLRDGGQGNHPQRGRKDARAIQRLTGIELGDPGSTGESHRAAGFATQGTGTFRLTPRGDERGGSLFVAPDGRHPCLKFGKPWLGYSLETTN